MRSRIGLALLALAGLLAGVPQLLGAAGGSGSRSTADAVMTQPPAPSALLIWLVIGAVGIGVGVAAVSLTRRAPAERPLRADAALAPEATPEHDPSVSESTSVPVPQRPAVTDPQSATV